MAKTVRMGAGAGFQGDRLEPAIILATQGELDWLVLECLAERTIALAQLRKLADPAAGYDPLLERRLRALLAPAKRNGVRIVTNMGAANPLAAGRRALALARELGLDLKVAVVTGDDVLGLLRPDMRTIEARGAPLADYGKLVSANAHLGAEQILPALATGADLVITGRVADPSLVFAPLVHAFGWALDDWPRLGRSTIVGHLLENAGHVTGGYFADPGVQDVPNLAHLGFPFCDVDADGNGVLGTVAGTGGLVSLRTVKEQLLYEVADPADSVAPDVVADFTAVRVRARHRRHHLARARPARQEPLLRVARARNRRLTPRRARETARAAPSGRQPKGAAPPPAGLLLTAQTRWVSTHNAVRSRFNPRKCRWSGAIVTALSRRPNGLGGGRTESHCEGRRSCDVSHSRCSRNRQTGAPNRRGRDRECAEFPRS